MKTIIAVVCLSIFASGCAVSQNHLGYGSSTVVGLELSTGTSDMVAPVSLTLGYRRYEALVCPVGSSKVPSILTNVNGQIGAGIGVETTGQQSLALGQAADNLSKEIK